MFVIVMDCFLDASLLLTNKAPVWKQLSITDKIIDLSFAGPTPAAYFL